MLASGSYTFADVVWNMFIFFAWVLWFWLLFTVFADLFRRDDISGWGKTGWVVFVILIPFIGVFTYLIVEGRAMGDRRAQEARQARADMDAYVKSVASNGNMNTSADQIARAKQLLDNGAITQDEFQTLKAKALASSSN